MHIENDPRRSRWASIISEFKSSGLTQSDFCKNNELRIKQFNYWFRKFKQEICSSAKCPNTPMDKGRATEHISAN